MISIYRLAVFVSIILCYTITPTISQNIHSRIRVQSGGSVAFNINSLRRYDIGMESTKHTMLAISFNDIADPNTKWKLEFKAREGFIYGDYGSTLNLDHIKIRVEDGGGSQSLDSFIPVTTPITLTDTEQILVSGAPQGGFNELKLLISYQITDGINTLLGQMPDYYFIDIEFLLSAE